MVIDPGHQQKGDLGKEPVGPGASETKYRVSYGTQGVSTGIAEYELNLAVSLLLRDELVARGYTVYMTRETNDVNMSNVERAQFANSSGADICLRIHANGSENASSNGALMVCQTANNPYVSLHEQSYALSQALSESYCAGTGLKNLGIWETDSMSGINWCEIPSVIVEMGFMSNAAEDELMATADARAAMARALADGVDAYYAKGE